MLDKIKSSLLLRRNYDDMENRSRNGNALSRLAPPIELCAFFTRPPLPFVCFYLGMLKLTYGGLFDMGMETDLRGPNSEEDKFDWFFLGKEKGGEAKTHF